ncbi:MAG: efflux RND transporter periplasmic adaptor subunit [Sandaracinus sp.]|nr:efflux RND transporter periplasmic adaptor subunit [Sandaracinus sp.]MCB9615027.1 efflux RND transporter periplasmic adaptor subunit [Sandaracinus sp.]
MIRRPIGALSLLLAVACGNAAADDEAAAPPAGPHVPPETPNARAVRVETAAVQPSSASLRMRLPGEVEGSRDALLGAALGGLVEAVSVEEGERVRSGALLVRVDAATHGARVAQARVEVEAAERELARAERLEGTLPQQQLDAARTRVAAAQAGLRMAQVASSRAVVRAPFAGTVAALNAERGEIAAPGAPLVRLVQLDPVHVTLAVPDRDVVALRPEMAALVRTNADPSPREGRILRISPAADLQTRAFEVIVELPNADGRLLPGMIAQVEVTAEGGSEQFLLPSDVLVTRLGGNGVFVAREGVAVWRPLEIESVVRDQVIVRSGLSAGDEVVVVGHRELQEGDPLLVGRRGRCCTDGRVTYDDVSGARAEATPATPAAEARP